MRAMAAPIQLKLTVNGKPAAVTTPPDRSLLEVLREDLQLTGTKYGCGEGACGASSGLVDGKRLVSFSTRAAEVAGNSITTIVGLGQGDKLHPIQEAFLAEGSFQCGFCTPGMILATVALLDRKPRPSDAEIAQAMNGNLCRCCTYPRIIAAVRRAAQAAGDRTAGRAAS
jgi:aerobic-type carbon monoxide dehydrogenase small subunit (CoxS/CutS family)